MARLHLNLLGGFEACVDAGPARAITSKKARGLLAYLAVSPNQWHLRQKLAALLWVDSTDEAARNNLRQTLSRLRHQLPACAFESIASYGDSLAFVGADAIVDVIAFERLLDEGTIDALQEATALYKGAFLEGLTIGAPVFEAWLDRERRRLHELALDAYAKLLAHQIDGAAKGQAVATAKRLVALDPFDEFAHRCLMQLYEAEGRPASALRQYQLCAHALRCELDVQPEEATTALYREIRVRRGRGALSKAVAQAEIMAPRGDRMAAAASPAKDRDQKPPTLAPAALPRWLSWWRGRLRVAATALAVLALGAALWRHPVGLQDDHAELGPRPAVAQASLLVQDLLDSAWVGQWQAREAQAMLIEALALDPLDAEAHAKLGLAYWLEFHHIKCGGAYEFAQARKLARKAVALGNSPLAYRLLAKIYLFPVWEAERNHDRAIAAAKLAVALDPENPSTLVDFAEILLYSGRPDEALAFIAQARQLNLQDSYRRRRIAGQSYLLAGQYMHAAAELMPLRQASSRRPYFDDLPLLLAASLAHAGLTEAAAEVLRPYRERYPAVTVEGLTALFKVFRWQSDVEVILRGVALAGVPENAQAL
jgi:DNA-binding SARP family transcriptional activator